MKTSLARFLGCPRKRSLETSCWQIQLSGEWRVASG
jgi:hypothetical protein